jgi:hypothetical protein
MLLVLYSYIIRDLIQGRFLFIPAVLLYPWVGHGIALVSNRIKGSRHAHILRFSIVLLLVITPFADSVLAVTKSDIGALDAGRFISQDKSLVDAKVLFSDTRQWLYGNRSEAYLKIWNDAWEISKNIEDGQPTAIEQKAINENADAIVLAINYKKSSAIPQFSNYSVYQKFPSRKGVTIIYRRIDQEKK